MSIRLADRIEYVGRRAQQLDDAPASQVEASSLGAVRRLLDWHTISSANEGYRNFLEDHGVRLPLRINSLADLSELPVVDKTMLAASGYSRHPGVDGRVTWVETSGTTSSQVRIAHSRSSIRTGLGDSFLRTLSAAGLGSQSRYWTIGHRAWPGQVTGSYLSFVWLERVVRRGVVVTNTADDIDEQVELAGQHRPDCIASSPGFLARLALALGDRPKILLRPAVVLYGGAALNAASRAVIVEVLRPGAIVAFYPTTDAGPLGMSVPDDGVYRCFTETHHVEVIDAQGDPVGVGERGDLVVTVLRNTATPLIRYRIGDEATIVGRGNRLLLADIARKGDAVIADGLLPLAEVQAWADELHTAGHRVQGVQLRVRSGPGGIDEVVIRLFGADIDACAEDAARRLLLRNHQVSHGLASGALGAIAVERVAVTESLEAGWKIPPFVDERSTTATSRPQQEGCADVDQQL